MRPLRANALIDAPIGAVRRALIRTDVWTRTARALDASVEIAGERVGPRAALRTGDLIRIWRPARGWRALLLPPRSLILRVTVDLDRLPTFDVLAGPAPRCRITLTTESTEKGTLVTITAEVRGIADKLLRGRMLRVSDMVFGILTLASSEQLVVVAGAIIENGRVLAARRSGPVDLAGKWELPGGKVEPGETDAGALARELVEELSVEVTVGRQIGGEVDLGNNTVLRCYRTNIVAGDPVPNEHDAVRWVGAGDIDSLDWLAPDREVFVDLRRLLTG